MGSQLLKHEYDSGAGRFSKGPKSLEEILVKAPRRTGFTVFANLGSLN